MGRSEPRNLLSPSGQPAVARNSKREVFPPGVAVPEQNSTYAAADSK
jgi:hypothetical protein